MEIQLWKEILTPYDLAVRELLVKFNHIISEYRSRNLYSPIETVTGRVKSISSILEKCRKKDIPIENITEQIEDIAGMRIMCQFVEDIYKVVDIIKNRSDMKIVHEKDYIKNVKPSGYRSYHLIVNYNVETMEGTRTIFVEIQIRTLAMNFWASTEHQLRYKKSRVFTEEMQQELKKCADIMADADDKMQNLANVSGIVQPIE